MKHLLSSLCLGATLCVSNAYAATSSADTASSTSTSGPAAFVYVTSNPSGGANEINVCAASASGTLQTSPGSPFREDVASMAVNGRYLFAATRQGIGVDTFSIEWDGALLWLASKNTVLHNPSDCGDTGPIFLDHTGSTLYNLQYRNDCSNNTYQSLSVYKPSGTLSLLGTAGEDAWLISPASFLANNIYAYSADCLGNLYWEVNGYKRSSNGLLRLLDVNVHLPAPRSGDFWCPALTAADTTNHVALTLQGVNQDFNPDGAPRLVSMTADAAGNLSTGNTLANMPATQVGAVADLKMSPTGRLLAVAGANGLQVFHFNGGAPITHDTGLLTTAPISQIFWDKEDHLYAISRTANKLFVFTVTPTTVQQAVGSPHTVEHPVNLIVQPRTPVE